MIARPVQVGPPWHPKRGRRARSRFRVLTAAGGWGHSGLRAPGRLRDQQRQHRAGHAELLLLSRTAPAPPSGRSTTATSRKRRQVHDLLPAAARRRGRPAAADGRAGWPRTTTRMDILGLDVTWEAEFAQAGWVEPWTGANKAAAEAGTLKPALDTAIWKGKLYAVPDNSNTQLLWYRLRPGQDPAQDVGPDVSRTRLSWRRKASRTTSRSRARSTRAPRSGSTPWWPARAAPS